MLDASWVIRLGGFLFSAIWLYYGGRLLIRHDFYYSGTFIPLERRTALLAGGMLLAAGTLFFLFSVPLIFYPGTLMLGLAFALWIGGLWVMANGRRP